MATKLAEEVRGLATGQLGRGERLALGAGEGPSGPAGAPPGTSGDVLRAPTSAYVGVAVFVVALLSVNVLTVLHDARGVLEPWRPLVTEYTAAALILAATPAVAWLALRIPAGQGYWARFAAVHLAGSVAFCMAVVAGFVLMRTLVFAALGRHYSFGPISDLLYEYRKIALVYFGMVAAFQLSARLAGAQTASPALPTSLPSLIDEKTVATFDIREGGVLIRSPIGEIVAVRSAGNYVEFALLDGRRPLMRATLSSVEQTLGPRGFVRTHRSWLVNPTRLRSLEPEGSGDWRVLLEGGEQAPLSRRFPMALQILRSG